MNKEDVINPLELDALCEHLDNVNCQLRKKINNLQQENKQLKDKWNKLKEIIDVKMYNSEYLTNLCGYKVDVDTLEILKIIKEKMKELGDK